MIVLVIDSDEVARAAEALRAAIGLGLRGDAVRVFATDRSAPLVERGVDPDIDRALITLGALERLLEPARGPAYGAALHDAAAVEVWT